MGTLGPVFIAIAIVGWWLSRGEGKVFGALGYGVFALVGMAGVVCCLLQYGLLR